MNAHQIYQEAVGLLRAGNPQAALDKLHLALEICPDHPDYLSERGVVYFHLEKFDLALIDLDRAQLLEPENPYRYSSRAYVKDRVGDLEGAITDYSKAVELDPEDAVAYNNLGLVQEKMGYQNKAQSNFNKADELADKKGFFDRIPDNEKQTKPEPEKFILPGKHKTANYIKKDDDSSAKKESKWGIIKSVFTSKEGFKDFMSFIFKRKKQD